MRASAWRITPAGMEEAWDDLLDANGRFLGEAEKAIVMNKRSSWRSTCGPRRATTVWTTGSPSS